MNSPSRSTDSTYFRRSLDPISCAGLFLLAISVVLGVRVILSGGTPAVATSAVAAITLPPATSFPAVLGHAQATPTASLTLIPPPPTPTFIPTRAPEPIPTRTPRPTQPSFDELALFLTRPPAPLTPSPTPWPQPTPQGYFAAVRVPILMYHYLSAPPEDADIYRTDLSVTPDNFRAQMAYLAQNGYSTVDFYALTLAMLGRKELPPKPVIVTFDDGYVDAYLNAFPILREFGFSATFFIITEFVDFEQPGYLSWPMIEEMVAAGMRMEPHTKTHQNLDKRERDYVIYQILGSQETLAAHIGYTPRYFAYPGGRYDEQVIDVLRELDFWGAVTTAGGTWHDFEQRYEWTRMRVRYTTALPEFADLVK